jgi:hypothetical protein
MTKAFVGLVALSAFVGYCFYRGGFATRSRGEVKEDLNRWEGEGGNVPAVATPSPAPVPQSSYATPGSEARH